jgi:hypothetical protein
MTPHLRELHWLPVPYRVDFKIAVLTYRCLNRCAPSYLSSLISRRERKILPPSRDISPRFYFKRLMAEILAIENLGNFSSFSEDFRH